MADVIARDEVSALARGIALLRALMESGVPLSNKELAEATGIPKATVSRLTSTLLSAGLLRQSLDSERYSLGPTTLQLSNAYLSTYDFRQQARMHLAELADAVHAHVHLGVRDGLDILLIDSIRPKSAFILSRLDVGSRMAMATSASGRAYLSVLPAAERITIMAQMRQSYAEDWPLVESGLTKSMHDHARLGFCTSFGDWHPDINALGFALYGPRGELYAVSIGGPAYKLSKEYLIEKVTPLLQRTCEAIAAEAGIC